MSKQSLYLYLQRKRIWFSMLFFWLGIILFLTSAVFFYLHGAAHMSMILTGVSVWSGSIVYHLHSVSQEVLSMFEES